MRRAEKSAFFSEDRLQQAFAACALATLVLLGVFLKARLSAQTPGFNPEDETGYYSAAGWSYRLLPRPFRSLDFRWFTILRIAFVASLTIPALYALALRPARRRG